MQNWNIAVTTFSKTPLLDTIRTPDDLRKLKIEQVQQVADELRQETIDAVSVTGGHFGAGLGVVELTTAIHYIFDTPRDRKSTRLNSSHLGISYAVFCLKKKTNNPSPSKAYTQSTH